MKRQTKLMVIPFAAMTLTLGTAMMSYAATGWTEEEDTWCYYDSNGDRVTDSWKKSGDHWFWLNEDGEMAADELIEDDGNYYYVNEAGARVRNEWRELDNEDADDDESDTCWYYFGSNGKAYTASNSGSISFKTINGEKYAFDSEGKMLYGWIDEDGERLTDDDAWKTGVYYLGEAGDGVQRTSEWVKMEVEDDENEDDDFDGTYWFYFKSNGKKISDTTKKINGKNYRFAENGNAVFNWYQIASSSVASASNMYYNEPDQCWRADGWFKSVPSEDVNKEGYDDGDEFWYYAQKDGELVKSQIKKINGKYYAFNEYGEMLEGLYKMSVNDHDIVDYVEIESDSDLPEADEGWEVYYFAEDGVEGVMATGKMTLDLDGETYTYNFRKSGSERGMGYNGIHDGILYIKGRTMKADSDAKYEGVEWEDNEYLVNTSGKIQKNKKNAKDGDDYYYCTDSDGVIIYRGAEKYTND